MISDFTKCLNTHNQSNEGRCLTLAVFVLCNQLTGSAGGTAAVGDKESEERTRSALIAWLGSDYIDRSELETRLAALAQDVSDDLNRKIDKAAVLAATAAGIC